MAERDGPANGSHHNGLDADSIFGVRIVRDADPAARALRLAEDVDGEVVNDLDHATHAFAARADAGRAEPVVLKDVERAALEVRADAPDDAEPAVSEVALVELQNLADELAMTERIRSDTEAEFTDSLSRRLSAASAVAIHPSAIRQAAAAVTDAESEVERCDAEIAALGDRPEPPDAKFQRFTQGTAAPLPSADDGLSPKMNSEDALETKRRSIGLAVGVAAFCIGAAVVLFVAGVALPIPIAVLVVGLVLAIVLVRRKPAGRPDATARAPEPQAAPVHTGSPAEDVTAVPPPPPPPPPVQAPVVVSEEEWVARRSQLEAIKKSAVERLRSSTRHWESLVGPDADPHQVEDLVRVRDPQLELVGAASKTSPTIRTVSAVHRRTFARWRVAWAAVGYDEPPELDDVDAHLERLRNAGNQTARAARERLQAAAAWSKACATIDRPIVLVEPERWLPADTLEAMLGALPAGAEVIIVEQDGADSGDANSTTQQG